MSDLTDLLKHWNSGEDDARGAVVQGVYSELRKIAARQLVGERARPVVQPTVLVHEAYLRLSRLDRMQWQSREHFLAMAARVMREFLVDEARKRAAGKRDGGVQVTMHESFQQEDAPSTDILALNEAMERLARADPERALMVELKFFAGLTIEEIAEILGKSTATIKRSWKVARAWLYREMTQSEDE